MKIVKHLFSSTFMAILLIASAVSMAVATFIENDFGAATAYDKVYNALWFEIILLLLAVNLVGQILNYKLYRKSKLTIFTFHISFILILIGAGITRYFGYEGSIHIREGETQNMCFSNDKYIGYIIEDTSGKVLAENDSKYRITSPSAQKYKQNILIGNQIYELDLARVIQNADEAINDSPDGVPIISLLITKDMTASETLILKQGESKNFSGVSIGFEPVDSTDITINIQSGAFYIRSKYDIGEMSMTTQKTTSLEKGKPVSLKTMQILTIKDIKLVPEKLLLAGVVKPVGMDPGKQNTGKNAFIFHLFTGNKINTFYLWETGNDKLASATFVIDGKTVRITYGSKIRALPFNIRLNDFIFERYPGSNSPSGYKSDVVLIDNTAGVEKPFVIFMNKILKYKGYRFYQSSYDKDEKGTILSVNHDPTGMLVTYTGYGLLFLFILLSIINKNSVFRNIKTGYWDSPFRKVVVMIIFLIIISGINTANAQKLIPDRKAAEIFGKILVQDQKGRTKPLFALSNDILRKVTREYKFEGLSSMQVFLGLYLDFNNWKNVPLIKISDKDIQRKIGIRGNFASFSDVVDLDQGGIYKLSGDVDKVYAKAPGERSKMDKELIKVDERVNIVYMINKGEFMKVFPLKNGTHNWGSYEESIKTALSQGDSINFINIIPMLEDDFMTNNIVDIKKIAKIISDNQARFAGYKLPSKIKINAEVFYYKIKIFERLFPFYAMVGLVMLIVLISMVIRGKKDSSSFIKIISWLLFVGFLFHTFGLGLRWYIAGHSPMSNGYESMIFISWVTLLAGFIFSRKSAFALSATAVLASMTLMVAHLSFMDPEITNLVPVLKSYWLTLHVSIITGSYGFLGLGAILGLLTLILLLFSNKRNFEKIGTTVEELTLINFKTLTLGLYFLTIGTFLGAVWANESWGRYWGWDPKETWSLITIIIYTLVIHSRMIPGMRNVYIFNTLSLFAFLSVLMTYFGVNYYLSGLHSYASGDRVPVPSFVYITVIVLAAVSFFGYLKYSTWKRISEK